MYYHRLHANSRCTVILPFHLQVIQAIRTVEHRKKRFQSLIDQLLAVCLEISPDTLEGLPRIQLDHGVRMEHLRKINHQQVKVGIPSLLLCIY